MNVRERLLALKFLEKQKKHSEYARQIGVEVKIIKKEIEDENNDKSS